MRARARPHESPAAQRKAQIRVLDDVWLLTLFALLLATGVPWFVSGFHIAFGPVLLGALGLGALHMALTFLGESESFTGAARVPMLTALHAAGVVTLGIVWHNAGGLQNPAALAAFVRSWTNTVRVRVRSRSCRTGLGGTNQARTMPRSTSLAGLSATCGERWWAAPTARAAWWR